MAKRGGWKAIPFPPTLPSLAPIPFPCLIINSCAIWDLHCDDVIKDNTIPKLILQSENCMCKGGHQSSFAYMLIGY